MVLGNDIASSTKENEGLSLESRGDVEAIEGLAVQDSLEGLRARRKYRRLATID
jgi:hypothetical protein